MARLFKRLICVHGALDLFINAPALLGHHCRPRAEYKVIYVSCQVTMARHDLVMPLLTTWRHTNRPTRPCLISWYGEGQWASHSTFISNHNMSHCLSSSCCRTHCQYISRWWRHQMAAFSALLVLCEGNPLGHRWIPLTKASDEVLWCFLWYAPEQTVEETLGMPVIWDALLLIVTSL